VTVFEAFHAPGGVLIYGIPEFRLPKDIVQAEVDRLVSEGVKIEVDAIIGRTYTVPELREEYDALFLAVGAGLPVFMNVPGENLKGVYSANEYLTRNPCWNADSKTPDPTARRVVGGGNVAMDSVRTAQRRRRGATIVYRRSATSSPPARRSTTRREAWCSRLPPAPIRTAGQGITAEDGLSEPDKSGRRRSDRGLEHDRLRPGGRGHGTKGQPAAHRQRARAQ
jgi:glutamate synthase (NADPH/NADH) small chain